MSNCTINLSNRRINVEVARPGEIYQGSRFDWSGWITKVTLDGEHTFTSAESLISGEGTGGFGLCNEFSMNLPIGYHDCLPGETFLKLGVGLLTRPDEAEYNFFRNYSVNPFPIEITQTKNSITFELDSQACRGYEARLKKTISIEENMLRIDYQLINVGSKSLESDEYNHNFVNINGSTLGPAYRLQLPFQVSSSLPKIFKLSGDILHWLSEPHEAFYFREDCPELSNPSWVLTHEPSGVAIKESVNMPLVRFALWGRSHVVSPELFIKIKVDPGQTIEWRREYCFISK
jgi:hypothetical protein